MPKYTLLISGAPASGKSSIAHALAAALPSFALLEKDVVKEALYDEATEAERSADALSRHSSRAAVRVLWALAPRCPRLILEANFHTREREERERFAALEGQKLELHCRCAYEIVARRFAERASMRHPAHTLRTLSPELFTQFAQPFGLSPLIEVDTGKPVDLEALIQKVHAHWPALSSTRRHVP